MNLYLQLKLIMKRGFKQISQLEANAISAIINEDKNNGFGLTKDLKAITKRYMKEF